MLPFWRRTIRRLPGRAEGSGLGIKDLMAMKVDELKLELEERGEAKSGNKAWLRRRLHAAILRHYLEGWMDDEAYGF